MEKTLQIGRTYVVTTASECTVTDADGLVLANASAGSQSYFTATTTTITFSDDSASVVAVFKGAPALGGGGGSYTLTAEDVKAVVPIAWKSYGVKPVVNDGYGIALGDSATAYGIAIGYQADSFGWDGVSLGRDTSAGRNGVSVGREAETQNAGVSVGYKAISESFSISVGNQTQTLKSRALTLGAAFTETVNGTNVTHTCQAEGTGSITIGAGANTINGDTESSNAVTIGCTAANSAADSVCVGANAQVSAGGGIAIGAGAVCADVGAVVFASYSSDRSYKTQLYFAGAGTPLAVQYYNGEAMIGYIVTDSAGNTVACGTNKLSALFPDNSTTQAATVDADGEWVMPTLFAPNDVKAEPSSQAYTPLPVYPIVEPEIEELTEE